MKIPMDNERCLFTRSNGYRCRMARMPEESLCAFHSRRSAADARAAARKQQAIVRQYFQGETAAQLFPGRRDHLDSARGVNRFLARVARLVAECRIEPKVGAALSYIGQTLLASLPHITREQVALKAAESHPLLSSEQMGLVSQLLRTLQESLDSQDHRDAQQTPSSNGDPDVQE